MKNLTSLACVLLTTVVAFTSCKKNEDGASSFDNRSTSAADYVVTGKPVVTVSGDITSTTTWSSANVYEISGIVTVRGGAVLNIQAGTYIKSTPNVAGGSANGVLVIAKDGQINAVGTPTSPIVFTSRNLLDANNATVGAPGDFGGVIILGSDNINLPSRNKLIEGLPDDSKYYYGGTDAADNSGTFKYVRIEYAGFRLAENVEVNGLTLGGVGVNTVIDHVQVSFGLDDGFEFFGGNVSPSYLVSLGADDDQFDFDNGYRGTIQYAIALADKTKTHSTSSGSSDSNGIESDNNAPIEDATFSLTPKTHPILSNFSIIGTETLSGITAPGYKYGVFERRGSEVTLTNSVITGYPSGIIVDATANAALSTISGNDIHGFSVAFSGSGNNTSTGSPADPFDIAQPFYNVSGLNLLNSSTSTGAITSASGNWIAGWTKFTF